MSYAMHWKLRIHWLNAFIFFFLCFFLSFFKTFKLVYVWDRERALAYLAKDRFVKILTIIQFWIKSKIFQMTSQIITLRYNLTSLLTFQKAQINLSFLHAVKLQECLSFPFYNSCYLWLESITIFFCKWQKNK